MKLDVARVVGTMSRTRGGAVVGGLVVFTAVACGGASHSAQHASNGAEPAGSASVLTAAYTKTVGARTARVALQSQFQASNGGSSVIGHSAAAGEFDFARHIGELSTQLPTGGTATVIEDLPYVYVKVPKTSPQGPISVHTPWIRINVTALQSKSGQRSGLLNSAVQDPAQALSYLRALATGVTTVGSATVGGAPTTHYRITVDLAKVAARDGGLVAAQIKRLQQAGVRTLPVDVWVDKQGLVRQLALTEPIPSLSGSPEIAGRLSLTVTFSDFGVPVQVTIPPANQVTDLTNQLNASPQPGSSTVAANG